MISPSLRKAAAEANAALDTARRAYAAAVVAARAADVARWEAENTWRRPWNHGRQGDPTV